MVVKKMMMIICCPFWFWTAHVPHKIKFLPFFWMILLSVYHYRHWNSFLYMQLWVKNLSKENLSWTKFVLKQKFVLNNFCYSFLKFATFLGSFVHCLVSILYSISDILLIIIIITSPWSRGMLSDFKWSFDKKWRNVGFDRTAALCFWYISFQKSHVSS